MDQRRPRRGVPHTSHQLLGARSVRRRQGVADVPEIMKVEIRKLHAGLYLSPDPAVVAAGVEYQVWTDLQDSTVASAMVSMWCPYARCPSDTKLPSLNGNPQNVARKYPGDPPGGSGAYAANGLMS